ncbi:MAG: lipopolysaccharide heptosyltransferase I [bacterium]
MKEKSPRILLVRLSAVGDVINTLPALAALRQRLPRAHLAWLVEDGAASILEGHPLLDDLIVFERRRLGRALKRISLWVRAPEPILKLRRQLRRRRFDLLLDFHGNLRSGVLGSLAEAALRIGFGRRDSREGNFLFSDFHVSLAERRIHRVEKHLALLRPLGIRPGAPSYCLHVPQAARDFAADYVRARLQEPHRPLVVLHPGTSAFGAHKRWPAEHFARLAEGLVERVSAQVLVTHGPGEIELARQVAEQSRHQVLMPETASLQELAALIERASAFVSADTGPMHLAAALKVPVVALFGPKDPVIYGPYGTASRVLLPPLDCSPCGSRRCPDAPCMRSIHPERVLDAVLDLLEDTRGVSCNPLHGQPEAP